jgi:RNA polymerase sigma factor (sigma-70 family)
MDPSDGDGNKKPEVSIEVWEILSSKVKGILLKEFCPQLSYADIEDVIHDTWVAVSGALSKNTGRITGEQLFAYILQSAKRNAVRAARLKTGTIPTRKKPENNNKENVVQGPVRVIAIDLEDFEINHHAFRTGLSEIEYKELLELVLSEMGKLPEKERDAIAVYYILKIECEDYSIGEAAEILQLSKGAFRARLSRAKGMLLKRLQTHLEFTFERAVGNLKESTDE